MNQKIKITKLVLEILEQPKDEAFLKKTIFLWWFNTIEKPEGGLRLTEKGFQAFKQADLKFYKIVYENPVFFSNQLLVRLDNYIKFPYYLDENAIYVFSDRLAVELSLFSGNLYHYCQTKFQSKNKS